MKRLLLIGLVLSATAQARVTAISPQAVVANIAYIACLDEAIAIKAFPKDARTKQAIAVGVKWHKENPATDCTQIYINVIDNLAMGDEL